MLQKRQIYQNKWMKLVFLALIWLIVWSLFKDLDKVKRGFERIDEAQERLSAAIKQNQDLKQKMTEVETGYFKEKMIRDKLNMQLPGETVVVMPESLVAGAENEAGEKSMEKNNWEKWWEVIR